MAALEELYKTRFSDKEEQKKNKIWIEICRYMKKYLKEDYETVVDVAAGYGDFINNFSTNGKKYALDINPGLEKYVAENVTVHIGGIEYLKQYFSKDSVSLFFMSNFLEHITKEQISHLLQDEYDCLKAGGEVCILTPNIRYVGEKYWDFYDHITPITEKALIEEAESIGFKTSLCIKKFLPFTTKSALPQATWIVRLYLKLMPISGFVCGEQSLLIFKKL